MDHAKPSAPSNAKVILDGSGVTVKRLVPLAPSVAVSEKENCDSMSLTGGTSGALPKAGKRSLPVLELCGAAVTGETKFANSALRPLYCAW